MANHQRLLSWNLLFLFLISGTKGDTQSGLLRWKRSSAINGASGQMGENGEPKLNTIIHNYYLAGAPGSSGAPGKEGEPGDIGPKGDMGPQGSPGAPGNKGEPGDIGPKGDMGAPGSPGAPGNEGKPGDKGLKGDLGAPGSPGATGNEGKPGDKGLKGDLGAPGSPGAPGNEGKPGDKGLKGDLGAPGSPGAPGNEGKPGDKGLKGDPGAPGSPGAPGNEGKPGDKGLKGDLGAPGSPGAPGNEGKPGDKGLKGDLGAPGSPGAPGNEGKPGDKGLKGDLGAPGSPGAPGNEGKPGDEGLKGDLGAPGSPGAPGNEGKPGDKGLKGDLGPIGPIGPTGRPGPSGKCVPCGGGKSSDPVDKTNEYYGMADTPASDLCKDEDKGILPKQKGIPWFVGNENDPILVYCKETDSATCVTGYKFDPVTFGENETKPFWLSQKGVEMHDLSSFQLSMVQLQWLQEKSSSVYHIIRYHCKNTQPYYRDDLDKSIKLLTMYDTVIGPEPSLTSPLYYVVPDETDGCSRAKEDEWSHTEIIIKTNLVYRLPVVDILIKDIISKTQEVAIESVEICFNN